MSTSDPRHYDVIIAPVITEKATMASEHNKVTFKVAKHATKPQIKEAVEKLFDVKVKSVNTLTRPGKMKVFRNRIGQQSDVKRAIVTSKKVIASTATTDCKESVAMALKNIQSGNAGPAPAGDRRPLGAAQGAAGQVADRGAELDGWSQQSRADHLTFPGWWPQAGLSADRFPPQEVRCAGNGRTAGIRSEPHGLHRADQYQDGELATSRAAAPCRRRYRGRVRARGRETGQCHAGREHPGRYHCPQCRDQDRERRGRSRALQAATRRSSAATRIT